MKHGQFSKEFKLEVLRELDSGKSVTQVCRERDLKSDLIYRWQHEFRKDPEKAFSGKGNAWTIEAKNAELERLVGQLYAENRLLKKVLERLQRLNSSSESSGSRV